MAQNPDKIRIGTRGSPLALRQTEMVKAALTAANPSLDVETVIIKTSGDWSSADGETRLKDSEGGKGQFAKEIEEALLAGDIDAAVHSMKDMDSNLPGGLVIGHMLPREDPRDALLSKNGHNLDALPTGAVIGTASVRRQAFLLSLRPDLKIVPLRGNVGTRIDKMKAGQVEATLLACAGLKRLGLEDEITAILEPEIMLPAAGQGAVGIETREDDAPIIAVFDQINCLNTVLCVSAERAALQVLDGSCHTPIGAYAVLEGGKMYLRVNVISPDGKHSFFEEAKGTVSDLSETAALGENLGQTLKPQIPPELLCCRELS